MAPARRVVRALLAGEPIAEWACFALGGGLAALALASSGLDRLQAGARTRRWFVPATAPANTMGMAAG